MTRIRGSRRLEPPSRAGDGALRRRPTSSWSASRPSRRASARRRSSGRRGLRRGADAGRLPPLDPARRASLRGLRPLRPLPEGLGPALARSRGSRSRPRRAPASRQLREVGRDRRTRSRRAILQPGHGAGRPRADGPLLLARLRRRAGQVHEAQARDRAARRLPVPDRPGRPARGRRSSTRSTRSSPTNAIRYALVQRLLGEGEDGAARARSRRSRSRASTTSSSPSDAPAARSAATPRSTPSCA